MNIFGIWQPMAGFFGQNSASCMGIPKILELYATVSYRKYGLVLSDQLYARRVTVSRLCASLRGVASMLLSDYQRRYFAISISSASVLVIRAECSGVTQPRTSNER